VAGKQEEKSKKQKGKKEKHSRKRRGALFNSTFLVRSEIGGLVGGKSRTVPKEKFSQLGTPRGKRRSEACNLAWKGGSKRKIDAENVDSGDEGLSKDICPNGGTLNSGGGEV